MFQLMTACMVWSGRSEAEYRQMQSVILGDVRQVAAPQMLVIQASSISPAGAGMWAPTIPKTVRHAQADKRYTAKEHMRNQSGAAAARSFLLSLFMSGSFCNTGQRCAIL